MVYEYQLNWYRNLPLASGTHTYGGDAHVRVIKLNLPLEKKAFSIQETMDSKS